ncbi:MAG TPA: restriction endonuclease [Acidimicrobiia bacterium]|nr:restriction endonuclease [Acidimicrobiia bacterium]
MGPWYSYRVADDGGGRSSGAGARTIRSPDDAEQVAAEWMRHLGFDDARCTAAGTDGGVDVRSRGAVAQVKAQLAPVGRPELQALYGIARSEGRLPLFFSLMSYTAAAQGWADEVGMALFRFDHAGMVEAVNGAGEALLAAAGGAGVLLPPAWPVRLSDRAGRAAIARERRGLLFAERVAVVGLGWIWVQLVRLDYTVPTRRAVTHRALTLAFDLVSGAPFPRPGIDPEALGGAGKGETVGEEGPLPATMETSAVLRQITDAWEKLEAVTRPAVVERHRAALGHLGVPSDALTVSPSAGERVLAPVFVGLLEHRRDSRVVLCSGITGVSLTDLASHLTSRLPGALEEIFSRIRRL